MKKPALIDRIASTVIAAIALVIAPPEIALAQLVPQLKAQVEVSGEYVRLGDLFEHPGSKADLPVFRAPAPGGAGTIRAARLVRVAQDNGLDWDNPRRIPEVRVTRIGLLIGEDEIREQIAATLGDKAGNGGERTFEISFTSDPAPLYVASDQAPSAEVMQVRFSRRSGRFSAVIAAPADDPAAIRRTYTGRAVEVSRVPVLVHSIRRGAVISAGDVELRNVPLRRIESTTVTDIADLVGMAVTRTIRAGYPVRARDIEQPQIVHRNDMVTVRHKVPGLLLTARAKALESGALGDVIEIRNATSNRIIHGKVIGPELVEAIVTGPSRVANAN